MHDRFNSEIFHLLKDNKSSLIAKTLHFIVWNLKVNFIRLTLLWRQGIKYLPSLFNFKFMSLDNSCRS